MCKEFENLPKIIAVDFDGTLVKDEWPNIGEPREDMFLVLKLLKEKYNVKLILWTSRNDNTKYGDLLQEALYFCKEKGLVFDAVNENVKEVVDLTGADTRKVYADIYIDDKAVHAVTSPLYWVDKLNVDWIAIVKVVSPY